MGKLYVIGNGFDRFHGMETAYINFAKYLGQTNPKLLNLIEDYFPTDDPFFWWQFEENLAAFDADRLIENSEHLIVPYGDEEWSDSFHHDYSFELKETVEALSNGLAAAFTSWVRQIRIPNTFDFTTPLLRIDTSANFITFNYTATLESLYRVSDKLVWHIHGAAANPSDRLVLGHGWLPSMSDTHVARCDPERGDTRVLEGAHIIDQYFADSFKPTRRIIDENQTRLASLAEINDICVMGHSLSDVDIPYFKEIARHSKEGARWRVSYFGDLAVAETQFSKIGATGAATFHPIEAV